jgi:hypothetical protein
MQHPILRQQHGAHIQQFVEDLNIGYARMLGCQKYKLDRPLTQALAELPHQWGFLANAFVDDNPFYAEHGAWSIARRWPSYSIDAFDATIPRLWHPLPGEP